MEYLNHSSRKIARLNVANVVITVLIIIAGITSVIYVKPDLAV